MHNVLDPCISITRARGMGLAMEFKIFLGPVKWHCADEGGFMAHTDGGGGAGA